MCGIAGALGRRSADRKALDAVASMTACLAHRGPDDHGIHRDDVAGIALGHRRLSIVDLSPEGHQPMHSASGRFVIVFNGEIYNYRTLGSELVSSGARFRGHSDTEVLLAAIEQWGLRQTLDRLVGIFAFALWDTRDHALTICRDHLGVKPLYYAWLDDVFLFGSELKAIARHPAFRGTIDRDAVALLLRHNCIPAPFTVYREARKLPPGTFLTLSRADEPYAAAPVPYWSARDVVQRAAMARGQSGVVDEADAADALERLLRESVGMQMVADVPLGAFLSGGIDSTTVTALMQAQSARPIKTFTIGFNEAGFDESVHANVIARHLGTEHTELRVTDADARGVIPMLPAMYDEPFADSSQIPTYLVSRLARQSVTVALSGDGGDELFAGYNRHIWGERVWRRIAAVPHSGRRAASRVLTGLSPAAWDRLAGIGRGPNGAHFGHKIHKLAETLAARNAGDVYLATVSHWKSPASIVRGATEPLTLVTDRSQWPTHLSFTEQMLYLDLVSYLPDDILVKVDRASMAVGLEVRVPVLDHRIVEFAWSLPLTAKLRDGVGKRVLRSVLSRYVPDALVDRPKAGFGVPIGTWLRGPLREWAEDLLSPDALASSGVFEPAPIRAMWAEHTSGRRDRQFHLWDVLSFQAWFAASRA